MIRIPVLLTIGSIIIAGLLFAIAIDAASANGKGRILATSAELDAPESYLPVLFVPQPTPAAAPGWLWYVNQFRDAAGLPALSENVSWSEGSVLHSRYMVKEDAVIHSEDSSSPWYTAEGDHAGQNGNIYVSGWLSTPDESAIDFWMAAPFHAIVIIDPRLEITGFGSFREDIGSFKMGATLDVQRGRGGLPPGITYPITYPEDGADTWLTQFIGFEWPDPLTSCPGYSAPTGPAITIQLGDGGLSPNVSESSFSDSTTALPHCVFDETNYVNSNAGVQNVGRIILDNQDAVVILPRDPLSVGRVYTATVTANGNTISWSFTVVTPISNELFSLHPATHQEARQNRRPDVSP